MRKGIFYSCIAVLVLPVLFFSACGGNNVKAPSAPAIAKVRMWLTLSGNPDDPPVTTLTPEQTAQASIWARGTTEEGITFKVNLYYDDKFTTLVTGVHTEGSSKAVAAGGFATLLEPGKYTFKAISGAFGEVIGSLEVTVTSSLPPAQPSTPAEQPSLTPAPSVTPSEQASPPPTATSTLSEQPDTATFQIYFSELGLGKIPADGKFPQDLQRNTTVFTAGDQICLYGNIILECQLRNTVYDVGAKKVINEGGLPKPMSGGFAGWEPLTIPIGKYEYKVYVTDVLVAVFPFEVR